MQPRTFITPSTSTNVNTAPPAVFTFGTLPSSTQMTAEMTGVQAYTTDAGMCVWNGSTWTSVGPSLLTGPYGQTLAEVAAGIFPTQQFLPGDIRRYGATGDGVADDTWAILAASQVANQDANGLGFVYVPPAVTRWFMASNNITAITKAANCVITISTVSAINPFVVGQGICCDANTGGMTQIQGLPMTITAVGGVSGAWTITTSTNSSAFTTYTSGGTASGHIILNNIATIRGDGKYVSVIRYSGTAGALGLGNDGGAITTGTAIGVQTRIEGLTIEVTGTGACCINASRMISSTMRSLRLVSISGSSQTGIAALTNNGSWTSYFNVVDDVTFDSLANGMTMDSSVSQSPNRWRVLAPTFLSGAINFNLKSVKGIQIVAPYFDQGTDSAIKVGPASSGGVTPDGVIVCEPTMETAGGGCLLNIDGTSNRFSLFGPVRIYAGSFYKNGTPALGTRGFCWFDWGNGGLTWSGVTNTAPVGILDASGDTGIVATALSLAAGTTTVPPLFAVAGTNLTTAKAGAYEYDGTVFYASPATSSRAVSLTEYVQVISSPYTLTSQTAAQKLLNATTNGAVTLPIGTYDFECSFSLTSLNTGTSSVFGFALGGGATFTQSWWAYAAGAALATPNTLQGTFNTAANVALVSANTTGVGYAIIKGTIRVTVAGTVIPQVSLNTAAAGVVGANSYFRAWPVGNGTVTNVGNWS